MPARSMPALSMLALRLALWLAALCALACSSEGRTRDEGALLAPSEPAPAPAAQSATSVPAPPTSPATPINPAALPTPAPQAPTAPAVKPRGASDGPAEPAPVEPRFAGTQLEQDAIVVGLRHFDTLTFKPIGARAALFRTKLASPFEAAFKAPTAARPLGPQAEVASYAISRCLGLSNVPPAVLRKVPLELLRSRLDASAVSAWPMIDARILTPPDKVVSGALIFWIGDLSAIGVDKQTGLDRAREWLRIGGTVAESDYAIAMGISTMLGFDYIIGNFDRWSGGNVKGDTARTRVYVRDHDLAVPGRLSDSVHARLASEMQIAQRISKGFYERARELTPACIKRELMRCGVEGGELGARQLAGVLDRRDGFVSHVQALIEEHGETSVLVFP